MGHSLKSFVLRITLHNKSTGRSLEATLCCKNKAIFYILTLFSQNSKKLFDLRFKNHKCGGVKSGSIEINFAIQTAKQMM